MLAHVHHSILFKSLLIERTKSVGTCSSQSFIQKVYPSRGARLLEHVHQSHLFKKYTHREEQEWEQPNDDASSWWLDPTAKSAERRHHNRRETSETSPHSSHLKTFHSSHLTFSPQWRPRPVLRHPPSDPVPIPCPHGPTSLIFPPLHPPLSHFSFAPRRRDHSCSQWVSFSTFSVSLSGRGLSRTLWYHCRCSRIDSPADYWRLAPSSCPTCSTPVSSTAPTREPETSDLEWTRPTLSSGDSLSHRSFSIGPSSPPAQTSTASPGPALERGRFLQFNCNGILHCHAEMQDFLHRHQVLVAWVQEAKLGVNPFLKKFTDYVTVRRDRSTGGGGGGLVTLVHHSVP